MLAKITEQLEDGLPTITSASACSSIRRARLSSRRKLASAAVRSGSASRWVRVLIGQVRPQWHLAAYHAAFSHGQRAQAGPARFGGGDRSAFLRGAAPRHLVCRIRNAYRFLREEILLLRTLADLIAGARHNSLSFQKAQEQAITDGLTGVKTHRFFMEALSAEWEALDARGPGHLRWC